MPDPSRYTSAWSNPGSGPGGRGMKPARTNPMLEALQHQGGGTGEEHKDRLLVLEPPHEEQARSQDARGRQIHHRLTSQNDRRPRDGAGRGGRGALDEGSVQSVVPVADEPPS